MNIRAHYFSDIPCTGFTIRRTLVDEHVLTRYSKFSSPCILSRKNVCSTRKNRRTADEFIYKRIAQRITYVHNRLRSKWNGRWAKHTMINVFRPKGVNFSRTKNLTSSTPFSICPDFLSIPIDPYAIVFARSNNRSEFYTVTVYR